MDTETTFKRVVQVRIGGKWVNVGNVQTGVSWDQVKEYAATHELDPFAKLFTTPPEYRFLEIERKISVVDRIGGGHV